MLDMGFQPQVDRIVRHLPKDRQTMFFSATLDGAVGRIAEVYTRNPVRHEIESETQTVDEADHRFIPVESHGKLNKLIELAHAEEETGLTLVFVNTKRHVETLARQLRNEGVPTVTMHGDMTQQARERALQRFEDKHVGRPDRHRRRRARSRPGRHHARRELRPAAGRQGLRAPRRAARPARAAAG